MRKLKENTRDAEEEGEEDPERFYAVISIFQRRDMIAVSYVAEENPWMDLDQFYDEDSDRIFMISANDFYIGHVRVFEYESVAQSWLNSMIEKTNVWAYWRLGFPLGPYAEEQLYQQADGAVQIIAMFQVDERDQRVVANRALVGLKTKPQDAIQFYEAPTRNDD